MLLPNKAKLSTISLLAAEELHLARAPDRGGHFQRHPPVSWKIPALAGSIAVAMSSAPVTPIVPLFSTVCTVLAPLKVQLPPLSTASVSKLLNDQVFAVLRDGSGISRRARDRPRFRQPAPSCCRARNVPTTLPRNTAAGFTITRFGPLPENRTALKPPEIVPLFVTVPDAFTRRPRCPWPEITPPVALVTLPPAVRSTP